MWSRSSLIIMIAMKQLLGYVLHPVGVEMCRQFCCQVTGKPFCVYSPTALLCQATHRNRLQADDQWTVLETSTRHWAINEAKTTTCAVHSRLHRSRTKGVKCVAVSSKPKRPLGSDCVEANPKEPFQEEKTGKHSPVERKSNSWTKDFTKDYRRGTVGRETIYIKRIYFAMRWDTANAICEGDGGQLVKVDNKETLEEVTKLFNPFDSFKRVEVWIGLRDLCDNSTFLWLDGQAPTFTKWAPEEATRYNEGGHQGKCVKMRLSFTGMNWLSASCNSKHGYICQLLLPDKTTTLPKGEICCGSLKQTLGTSTLEIQEMH